MRKPVQKFIYESIKEIPSSNQNVLEVGSLDVNGTVRQFFSEDNLYVGLDMRLGKNVTLQARGDNIPFRDASFGCAVCCDTLEHDSNFFATVSEMKRVLITGGLLLLTVPGIGFTKHEHPYDYWRFTKEAVEVLMQGMCNVYVLEKEQLVAGKGTKPE